MTTPAFDVYNPAFFEAPVPPPEFGQDGGKFYHCYDALAEEIDDNLVKGLKEQLDGLLIFAGLFAGVNSAFLALTLPLMSPDPADDTNALLRENNAILLSLALGRNDSLPSANSLPSETFSPAGKVLAINVLFSLSLTLALISSFLAVLGRQWLVYYRKLTGGGPDRQRWEQLKRFLGAERWQLEWVLDNFLPSLLQIGLVIFCISLTIYLGTLHLVLSGVVGTFMCVGLAILIVTAIFAFWDRFCPFQSPLSRLIPLIICGAPTSIFLMNTLMIDLTVPVVWFLYLLVGIARALREFWLHGPQFVEPPWKNISVRSRTKDLLSLVFMKSSESFVDHTVGLLGWNRKEEDDGSLQITAIRRAICTSDDIRTLAHAVSNILGITDANLLGQLAADEDFDYRLSDLCTTSFNRTLQLCGRDRTDLAFATSWLYRAAVAHIFISAVDPRQPLPNWKQEYIVDGVLDRTMLYLPADLMQNANPNMAIACLGFVALFTNVNMIQTRNHRLALSSVVCELVNPSWRFISVTIEVILVQWGIHHGYHEEVHAAYTGKPSIALQNLKSALEKVNDPDCQDRDILRKYLLHIITYAGNAAAASRGDSIIPGETAAGFLRFYEGFIRVKDSSSWVMNYGRNLRYHLIRALRLECERVNGQNMKYSETPSKEMLEELCQLFTELTARLRAPAFESESASEGSVEMSRRRSPYWVTVGGRPMTISNANDDDLDCWFSPVLQELNTGVVAKEQRLGSGFMYYESLVTFKQQVGQLNSIFTAFKTIVGGVSAQIKKRKRDPDLGWCYYDEEECEPHARLESRKQVAS